MGNVLVKEETLTQSADAIREKNGSYETYKPRENDMYPPYWMSSKEGTYHFFYRLLVLEIKCYFIFSSTSVMSDKHLQENKERYICKS